ncbi:MAG: HAD family phosphatase [Spirochaetaceae bacterium]|nr:MAG: HAD family phosphatase [Spirochaetaceae bacterium]
MIKLYIFDMGGVVSRNTDVSGKIAEHLGIDVIKWQEIVQEELIGLMAGKIDSQQFWRHFSLVSGHRVDQDLWTLYFHPEPNPEVIETIRQLKEEARVVAGTNTIESHYRVHEENGDYDIFDRVYASQHLGLVKPDPAFYTHILDAEGCPPEHAVFVDDAEINVEATRKLGIHGLLFTGAGKLRRDLSAVKRRRIEDS